MNTSELRTLWVGDIEPWMTEKHLEDIFNKVGRVISVKLIKSKETNLPAGYCFIEFQTHDVAEKILMNFNSQPIPGAQGTFRMNWGKNPTNIGLSKPIGGPAAIPASTGYTNNSYGGIMPSGLTQGMIGMSSLSEFSVYVGELELGVNEQQLADHFRSKYSSVTGSKIITEPSSKLSKGYGFVKFSNSTEGQRAIQEMNGSIFKGKFMKVSLAVSRQAQTAIPGSGYSPSMGYGSSSSGYPQQDAYGQQLPAQSAYYPSQTQSMQQQQSNGYDYYSNQQYPYQYSTSSTQSNYYYPSSQQQQQQYYYSQYYYPENSQMQQQMTQYQQSSQGQQQQPYSSYSNNYYSQQQTMITQPSQILTSPQQQTQAQPYTAQSSMLQETQYSHLIPQQQLHVQQQITQQQQPAGSNQSISQIQQVQMHQQQQQQQQQALQAAHQGQLKQQQQQQQQLQYQSQQQQQIQQLQQLSQQKEAMKSQNQELQLDQYKEKDLEVAFLENDLEYIDMTEQVALILQYQLA